MRGVIWEFRQVFMRLYSVQVNLVLTLRWTFASWFVYLREEDTCEAVVMQMKSTWRR